MNAQQSWAPRQPRRVSRRLILGGLAATGGSLLAACGGTPSRFDGGVNPPGGGSSSPQPTPGRIFGVIPVPPPPSPRPTPQPIRLRFAHWETGAMAQTLSAIAQRFSVASPGVIVEMSVASFSDHFAQLQAGSAAGLIPDVFVNSGEFFDALLDGQVLRDLASSQVSDKFSLDGYWTDPLSQVTNGHLYAMPLWGACDLVFYNREWFTQKKVGEPTVDWTWDQLLQAAGQLSEGKPGEVSRWGIMVVNDLEGGWGSFVASNGGDWLDSTGRQVTLGAGPAQEALQWLVDAIVVHHVAPSVADQQQISRAGKIDPFLAGQVAMLVNGTWEMPDALTGAHFQWDVQRLPRAPRTGQSVAVTSVQPLSASRLGTHPEEAWSFLKFTLGAASQTLLAKDKLRLPAWKDVASDAHTGYAVAPPSQVGAVVGAMTAGRSLRFVPRWQEFRTAVLRALDPAFEGSQPLSDALAAAVTAGNAALAPPSR